MIRGWGALVVFALSACGIGVVGSAPSPFATDAGVADATAPLETSAEEAGAAEHDGAALDACLAVCPAPRGKCSYDGVCTITCDQAEACRGATVMCPDNVPCVVSCAVKDACNDVRCGTGSTCTVKCTGTDACRNIGCTGGADDTDPIAIRSCTIDCEGTNACEEIYVRADMVHVTCNGNSACNKVRCGNGSCLLDGDDHVGDSRCCNTPICTGFQNTGNDCFP